MDFWKPVKIQDNNCYYAKLGPLRIWLRKERNEMRISESRLSAEEMLNEGWEQEVESLHPAEEPDKGPWKRWIVEEKENKIKLLPVMPDRPVVVRPGSQIRILPNCKTLFFVSIPVWLRVVFGEEGVLTDLPTLILSNSWFGDPLSGELSYAVKSRAITNLEERKDKVYSAVCPITIENQSPHNFMFQRLSVHTEFLGIYAGKKNLWTNQIDVKLEGEEQKSIIDISENAPVIEKVIEQLSTAREVPSKKFYRKIFSDLPFVKG